jgi:hypothetical protein
VQASRPVALDVAQNRCGFVNRGKFQAKRLKPAILMPKNGMRRLVGTVKKLPICAEKPVWFAQLGQKVIFKAGDGVI